jgi:MoxR-like ATPase
MENNHEWFAQRFAELAKGVGVVIKGKDPQIRLALMCLVVEGHLLIEDRPGTGKTALARTMAALIDGPWSRIQFTPDLLPADVTGVTTYNQRTQTFEFHQGPVFANVVLADEINRAAPKTQSALLEVMEERQVTVNANTYAVPRPFSVVATLNPTEFEGTYSLPEAQLDRFLMRVTLGYPDFDDEARIIDSGGVDQTFRTVRPVTSGSTIQSMQAIAADVEVVPEVRDYILRLARSTRESTDLRLGVSTRGVIAMVRAARAFAAAEGRGFVTPDDVKALVEPVWAHRCILTAEADFKGVTSAEVLEALVQQQRLDTGIKA